MMRNQASDDPLSQLGAARQAIGRMLFWLLGPYGMLAAVAAREVQDRLEWTEGRLKELQQQIDNIEAKRDA